VIILLLKYLFCFTLIFPSPSLSSRLFQNRYEQRCSQLIGISMCLKNLTKKYPKYVHLKGSGFAIRSMGGAYMMVRGLKKWVGLFTVVAWMVDLLRRRVIFTPTQRERKITASSRCIEVRKVELLGI